MKREIISSHLNSKVFSLRLTQRTFCPTCSASSLSSKLTCRPVNTGVHFFFKLSVPIPQGITSFRKPTPAPHLNRTWVLLKNLLSHQPLRIKKFKSRERQNVAWLQETPVSRDCLICSWWPLRRADWADELLKEGSPRFTPTLTQLERIFCPHLKFDRNKEPSSWS